MGLPIWTLPFGPTTWTNTPPELTTTANSTTFTTDIDHPRPPSHYGELHSPSLFRPHLHRCTHLAPMPRRLSSPGFEDLFVLKTHHATSRLRQTPVGVPRTRPSSSIERRRRAVLRSSPSLRTKRWSTPKAASHQLLLPHKRYPYLKLDLLCICQALFVLAPPHSCFLQTSSKSPTLDCQPKSSQQSRHRHGLSNSRRSLSQPVVSFSTPSIPRPANYRKHSAFTRGNETGNSVPVHDGPCAQVLKAILHVLDTIFVRPISVAIRQISRVGFGGRVTTRRRPAWVARR